MLFDHFFNNALIEPFIKPLKTRLLFICRREGKEGEGDRAAYRRAAGGEGGDKAADAGPGAAPMEFRGGYGRGNMTCQCFLTIFEMEGRLGWNFVTKGVF